MTVPNYDKVYTKIKGCIYISRQRDISTEHMILFLIRIKECNITVSAHFRHQQWSTYNSIQRTHKIRDKFKTKNQSLIQH